MAENQQPDWRISELYEKSWEIIKNNKVLWIFGAAVAGLAAGGQSSFNFNGNSLGKTFSSPQFPIDTSYINSLLSSIPVALYVFLALEIFISILITLAWGIIGHAWSQGSLISAIQTAIEGSKPTISESSEKSFPRIKSLSWLAIIPGLILSLIALIAFLLFGAGFVFGPTLLKIIFGILMIPVFVAFIYFLIYLPVSQIWALRIAVLEKKSGKESLLAGYRIAKKKFWSMILLGLVNVILSSTITFVPLVIIAGVFIGGVVSIFQNQPFGFGLLGAGGVLLVVFLFALAVISAILTAFKAAVWTIAYNNIKGKYDQTS